MPIGRKMKNIVVVVVFYRKVHNFQMMINVFKTSDISYKMVQQNIERLEMCSANTLYVSDC